MYALYTLDKNTLSLTFVYNQRVNELENSRGHQRKKVQNILRTINIHICDIDPDKQFHFLNISLFLIIILYSFFVISSFSNVQYTYLLIFEYKIKYFRESERSIHTYLWRKYCLNKVFIHCPPLCSMSFPLGDISSVCGCRAGKIHALYYFYRWYNHRLLTWTRPFTRNLCAMIFTYLIFRILLLHYNGDTKCTKVSRSRLNNL